jgi:hypothetical protein
MRLGLYVPPFDELADPALIARLAAEAEEAGWDGIYIWDHVRWLSGSHAARAAAGGARSRTRCSLSVRVLSVNSLWRWRVGVVGGGGGVRADAQPYLGPRSGLAPGRRHDG